MVYLNQQQLLPYERLAQLCDDLFGQPLSVATLVAANERACEQLDSFAQALACQVPLAEVVHLDESGLRVDGTLHWLHVASTATLTCYGVHPKRGVEAMDALGIVGACRQWVVHDHWKPYFSYQQCQHALCNEHLLRELKFLWEEDGQVWAREMSALLLSFHRRRQKRGESRSANSSRPGNATATWCGADVTCTCAWPPARADPRKARRLICWIGWRILNGASWPSFGMDGCPLPTTRPSRTFA